MKRLISGILALLLVFCVTACGDEVDNTSTMDTSKSETTTPKETTTTITIKQPMISDEDSQLPELNDEIIEEYTNEDGNKVSVIKYDDNNVMICIEFSTDDIVTNIHLFTDLMNDNKYENDYDVSIYGLKDGSQIVRYSEKIGLMWYDDEYEKAFDNPSEYID